MHGFFQNVTAARDTIKTAIGITVVSSMFIIAASSFGQDLYSNEIEFTPYIVMPESLLYKYMNNDEDFIIYDVRTVESYKQGHLKGAVNLPWEKWETHSMEADFPKDKIVVLVSEDGENSFNALKYLLKRGYSELWVVEGGMQNWMYKDWITRGE